MSTHTTGPWEWDNRSPYILNAPYASTDGSKIGDGSVVMIISGRARARISAANARLIAAAPELLRGCQSALAYLADPASTYKSNRDAAIEIIRAAIAKAEGKE